MRAIALVLAIMVVEYLARHVLAPLVPVVGTPQDHDMLATGAAYAALSLVVANLLGKRLAVGLLRTVARAVGAWQSWAGGGGALAACLALATADRALWGAIQLPAFWASAHATIGTPVPWLGAATLILVNVLLIPIAEEWLWRGIIQPDLICRVGGMSGVALTAVLFSAKHVLVDASLGRALAIFGAGIVLGLVARSAGWHASALSHILLNLGATVGVLSLHAAVPRLSCDVPQPRQSPELQRATERVAALIDTRDPAEIRSLFAPTLIAQLGEPMIDGLLTRAHIGSGTCRYRCVARLHEAGHATELLACTRVDASLEIQLESNPPHRLTRLVLKPLLTP